MDGEQIDSRWRADGGQVEGGSVRDSPAKCRREGSLLQVVSQFIVFPSRSVIDGILFQGK